MKELTGHRYSGVKLSAIACLPPPPLAGSGGLQPVRGKFKDCYAQLSERRENKQHMAPERRRRYIAWKFLATQSTPLKDGEQRSPFSVVQCPPIPQETEFCRILDELTDRALKRRIIASH